MLRHVGWIEGSRAIIENAALVPAWEAQFRKDAIERTVHHGTHLEGNELSKEQAVKLVDVQATQPALAAQAVGIVARDRDIQEVINYRKVMEWIDQVGNVGNSKIALNGALLKQIHTLTTERILPETEQGQYRKVQVVIKNSRTGEITFRPPSAVEIPYQVDEFFEWLASDEARQHHPVLLAGITHYELVRIHPFTDGNGRTARAIALLLMYLAGYDVKRFFSLEEYYDENPEDYYKSLQSVSTNEAFDLTCWLEYFTKGLAIELDKIKQQVLKLSKDVQLKTKVGHQVALSERQIKILESIQKGEGKIVSSELETILPDVSVDTILRDLKDLTQKGLIKKKGHTKGSFYTLVE
jgi:Fic family protein